MNVDQKSPVHWAVALAAGCVLITGLAGSISGCSGKKVDESDPAALYQDAENDIKNDQYLNAIDKLKTIRNKFPYSKYSAEAQLRLGDVYFLQESFSEAAAAYETFRDLHPKHEKMPYAVYRIAESYFNDIPSNVARDLTPAIKAEDAYTEFIKRYPTDARIEDARKGLANTRELLAEKELYIGNFYYKDDQYDSAKGRYEKLLRLYPETKVAQEASTRLAETEKELSKKIK